MYILDKIVHPITSKSQQTDKCLQDSSKVVGLNNYSWKKVGFSSLLTPIACMADFKVALISLNPDRKNGITKSSLQKMAAPMSRPMALSALKYSAMTFTGEYFSTIEKSKDKNDQLKIGGIKWLVNAGLSQLVDPTIVRATKVLAGSNTEKLPISRLVPGYIARDAMLIIGSELSSSMIGPSYWLAQSMIFACTTTAHLAGNFTINKTPIVDGLKKVAKSKGLPILLTCRLLKVQAISFMAIGPKWPNQSPNSTIESVPLFDKVQIKDNFDTKPIE